MITLSSLDPIIASRSLLQHPFYLRWSKGELTMDDMKTYAKEYFHLVERVPGIVARVRDRATDAGMKERINQNMQEEQGHVALWKRFAKSVGVSEAELAAYVPSAKVQSAVRSLEQTAEQGFEQGVTAMYALELELPKIAHTKKDGLAKFYGLTSEDARCYFDEHMEEEKHLQVWRAFPVNEAAAMSATEASLTSQHQVLDAVCELRGIPLHC